MVCGLFPRGRDLPFTDDIITGIVRARERLQSHSVAAAGAGGYGERVSLTMVWVERASSYEKRKTTEKTFHSQQQQQRLQKYLQQHGSYSNFARASTRLITATFNRITATFSTVQQHVLAAVALLPGHTFRPPSLLIHIFSHTQQQQRP